MGKARNYDKELRLIDELKQENRLLKRRLAALQKQLSRIDITKHQNLEELVNKQTREDKEQEKIKKNEKLKHQWHCHDCQEGTLRIVIINKQDGPYYLRKCDCCGKRTKLQKYDPEKVEGIE